MRRIRTGLLSASLAVTLVAAAAAADLGLSLPAPVETAPIRYACAPNRPMMPRDSDMPAMYAAGDQTYSRLDTAAQTEFRRKKLAFDESRTRINLLVERYVAGLGGTPGDVAVSDCILALLESWADAGSLLGTMSPQASDYRKFVLPSIAIGLEVATRGRTDVDPARLAKIRRWVASVNDVGIEQMKLWLSKGTANNHYYWVGYTALLIGIANGDQARFAWGETAIRAGLKEISPEGFLPLEIRRESRSLYYHAYALEALAMGAWLLERNGRPLSATERAALHRLAVTAYDGYLDPAGFVRASVAAAGAKDVAQEGLDDHPERNLASVVPLLRLFPGDPKFLEVERRWRKFDISNLGPSMTVLFSRVPK